MLREKELLCKMGAVTSHHSSEESERIWLQLDSENSASRGTKHKDRETDITLGVFSQDTVINTVASTLRHGANSLLGLVLEIWGKKVK